MGANMGRAPSGIRPGTGLQEVAGFSRTCRAFAHAVNIFPWKSSSEHTAPRYRKRSAFVPLLVWFSIAVAAQSTQQVANNLFADPASAQNFP